MLTLTNAKVFDGHRVLPGRQTITLDDNIIVAVGEKVEANSGQTIDVDGMTVMPGMITCHLHADFYKFSLAQGMAGEPLGTERPPGVMMAIAIRTCRVLLESGFTGYVGASCSNHIDSQLKMAIAEGIVPGPRIRACSRHVGTTADINHSKTWWRTYGAPGTDVFGDGPDDMRKLVRNEIRHGAETIKVFASDGHGGVVGRTRRNIARDELQALVTAAHDRGVKVRAHVADKAMILECLELGVDIIDHGDGVDEECIEKMAKAGTYWVPSLRFLNCMIDLGWAAPGEAEYLANVQRMLPLAQKAGVRILVGDDYSGVFRDVLDDDPLDHEVGNYGREFAYYAALEGLAPEDVLSWGTSNAGELLVDQPDTVGVIKPGALADLVIVDGDPLSDLTILSRPEQSLKAVIRDGAVAIDRLPPQNKRMVA